MTVFNIVREVLGWPWCQTICRCLIIIYFSNRMKILSSYFMHRRKPWKEIFKYILNERTFVNFNIPLFTVLFWIYNLLCVVPIFNKISIFNLYKWLSIDYNMYMCVLGLKPSRLDKCQHEVQFIRSEFPNFFFVHVV